MSIMGDILTSDEGELIIQDGDLVVGDSSLLHSRDLIISHPGEWKQNPTIGVGIQDFTDDDDTETLLRRVRQELIKDGQKVNKIIYTGENKLIIDSEYE